MTRESQMQGLQVHAAAEIPISGAWLDIGLTRDLNIEKNLSEASRREFLFAEALEVAVKGAIHLPEAFFLYIFNDTAGLKLIRMENKSDL